MKDEPILTWLNLTWYMGFVLGGNNQSYLAAFIQVELNKAISLAGLTVLCLAFLVYPKGGTRSALCTHALLMLLVHTAYSTFKCAL